MHPVMVTSALRTEQKFVLYIHRGAISHSLVAWTAASIVFCIGHSEVCWQIGQKLMFEQTRSIC